jgi:hypothetical protein
MFVQTLTGRASVWTNMAGPFTRRRMEAARIRMMTTTSDNRLEGETQQPRVLRGVAMNWKKTRETLYSVAILGGFVFLGYEVNFGAMAPTPKPKLTSTCHTVHEVEYCRWSDGGYSMMMPDGVFYTRETVNEPWERYYPERDPTDGM